MDYKHEPITLALIMIASITINTSAEDIRAIVRGPDQYDRCIVDVKARRFSLKQVRLTNGYSKNAQEINRRYLLSLDTHRLLHSFRITAGLPSKARPLGGWEAPTCGLRGHFVGHYLSACAQMYAATGDEDLKNRAQTMVDELAKCQVALKSGYLSAFPVATFDTLEKEHGHGVWAPYYTIHKIMAGLLDVHVLCGNEQALTVLEKMARYFKARMDALPAEQIEDVLRCDKCNPQNEYGGMNDVLYDLYAVGGNKEYLEFAHLFDRAWLLGQYSPPRDPKEWHLFIQTFCNELVMILVTKSEAGADHLALAGLLKADFAKRYDRPSEVCVKWALADRPRRWYATPSATGTKFTRLVIEELHGPAESSDLMYWQHQTPLERLRAVQIDRQVAYGRAGTSRRLQRVLEVADRG